MYVCMFVSTFCCMYQVVQEHYWKLGGGPLKSQKNKVSHNRPPTNSLNDPNDKLRIGPRSFEFQSLLLSLCICNTAHVCPSYITFNYISSHKHAQRFIETSVLIFHTEKQPVVLLVLINKLCDIYPEAYYSVLKRDSQPAMERHRAT